ncbi:transposase [Aureimonas ureilytica]|uniref:transposase n=1 Tax=Aureimonas ureilytica TaxID=401562 RepID=UPI000ACBE7FA
MKKSKFTEAQIAFVLKQADEGTAVAEVCRREPLLGHRLSPLVEKSCPKILTPSGLVSRIRTTGFRS